MKPQLSLKSTKLQPYPQKIQSLDGPPLDFSFKNIRTLNQLLQNMPSSKVITEFTQQVDLSKTSTIGINNQQNFVNNPSGRLTKNGSVDRNGKQRKDSKQVKQGKQGKQGQKTGQDDIQQKLQIVRTIQTSDHNYIEGQNKKTINDKQKVQKKAKKIIVPQTTTLFLRYNKLISIKQFIEAVKPIFPNPINNLMWIDLSHNRLTQLSPDLGLLKNLKTLYLHANYISVFNELLNLKNAEQLRTLTIHANPLQTVQQFRVIIHSILPSLKKIDSTLLTKRQTERAQVLMKTMKKYPVVKNAKKPPEESENSQDEDDQ